MKRMVAVLVLSVMLSQVVFSADVVYSWNRSDKKIALTFDDGPHPVHTPEILDILKEYNVRATFFVIGQNMEYWGDLVEREAAEGHEIGNHTFSHRNLHDLTKEQIFEEIKGTERVIMERTQIQTHLLRPPEGKVSQSLCGLANEKEYTVVCWSIDTRDWEHTPSETIVKNVLSSVEGGDIILFHDFVSGKSPTPDALRAILPALIEEGYEFVTVSELMES